MNEGSTELEMRSFQIWINEEITKLKKTGLTGRRDVCSINKQSDIRVETVRSLCWTYDLFSCKLYCCCVIR